MVLRTSLLIGGVVLLLCTGCVTAPKSIEVNVGSGSRPAPVDSGNVPHPATLGEAQGEIDQAYANIRWLEDRVQDLEGDKDEYKRERDRYKDERDDCRDRLERYEDD